MPSHFRLSYFVIWTATLICYLTNGAPIEEKTIWDVFISNFDSKQCSFADYYVLPNYNDDKAPKSNAETYDLTVPLKACMNTVKGSSLLTPLCNEVFEIIYNISTCSKEVQAVYNYVPYMENKKAAVFPVDVSNVCKDFSANRDLLALNKEFVSYILTDKNYCSVLCKEDVAKACSFLLWGHKVQAFVHAVLTGPPASEKASPESGNEFGSANAKTEKDEEDAHKKEPENSDPSEKIQPKSVGEASKNHNVVDSSTKAITQKIPIPDATLTAGNDPVDKETEKSKKLPTDPSKLIPNEKSKSDEVGITEIQLDRNGDHKENPPKSENKPSHVNSKSSTKSTTTPIGASGSASEVSSSASKSVKHNINDEPGTADESSDNKALVTTSGGTSKNVVKTSKNVLTSGKSNAEEFESKVMPGGSTEKQKGKKTEGTSQSTNIAPVVSKADASVNELSKTEAAAVSEENVSDNGDGDAIKEITSSSASEEKPKTDSGKGADSDANKAFEKTPQTKADAEIASESEDIPLDNFDSPGSVGQVDEGNGDTHYEEPGSFTKQDNGENVDSSIIKNTGPDNNNRDQSAQSSDIENNVVHKMPSDSAGFPEQEDKHFFFYFITIVIFAIGGYVLFHNKQKIFALIIEGRHERRRRSGASYRKLETK